MGYKIFISYKYADSSVLQMDNVKGVTTVRDYVDLLETYFDKKTDNIYKGESDGEDLSDYSEDEIWEKLKERIFDSSITMVIISPEMKESGRTDKSQWIPWEIAYSLRETTRNDRTSHTNAMLAIVLPDSSGSYDYYVKSNTCCLTGCRTEYRDRLFTILRENMFNKKDCQKSKCKNDSIVYYGEYSYVQTVKWRDFVASSDAIKRYLDAAVMRQKNVEDYVITKEV